MAEYKRKKVHSSKKRVNSQHVLKENTVKEKKTVKTKEKKKPVNQIKDEGNGFSYDVNETVNTEPKKQKEKNVLKVLKGNKEFIRNKTIIISAIIVALVVAIALTSFLLPIGIIDSSVNLFKTFGASDLPVNFSGAIVEDCVQIDGYYYLLTDTVLSAYSKSGKEIFSTSHGLNNPVMSVSTSRALVFEQNGNTALIFSLSGLKKTVTTEKKIITASIGRNGYYSIVTEGDEYSSSVLVYSRNHSLIYTWNSSKEIVNNVCISPFGKKIAVSTLDAVGGKYKSALYVFDFKSANPKLSVDFAESPIYSLYSTFDGFSVITAEKYSYFDWSDFERKDISSNERTVNMFKIINGNIVVVFNRENDKTDNEIKILNKSGKEKSSINFKGVITDFTYNRGNTYIISDTKANIINEEGKITASCSCEFGCEKIAEMGGDTVAFITDDGIKKLTVESEK